ncbi:MAG: hypothetical protein RL033_2313 [Pseudomonadota bacterium]
MRPNARSWVWGASAGLVAALGCYAPDWKTTGASGPPGSAGASSAGSRVVEQGNSPLRMMEAPPLVALVPPPSPGSARIPAAEGLPVTLPAPCANLPYAARLAAPPGSSWELLAAPAGFSFNVQTGELTGTPGAAEGGLLLLALRDAAGARLEVRYELALRAQCWLAYLDESGAAPTRLHLRDVFARQDIVLPEPDGVTAVQDFQFAPDGSWLALRAGTPERSQLYLYSTRSLPALQRAPALSFACTGADAGGACGVLDYAWSPDSRRLAVVLSGASAEQDYLTGVDLGETPGSPWPLIAQAAWGASSVPLDYHGQLVWAGNSWFGFLGVNVGFPDPALPDALYSAAVVTGAAGTVIEGLRGLTSVAPPPASLLRAAATGLGLVYNSPFEDRTVAFYRRGSGTEAEALAYHEGLLSPSGRWVAQLDADARLRIFDVADDLQAVVQTEPGICNDVLAWSTALPELGRERLACRYAQRIRVLDYSPAPSGASVVVAADFDFPASLSGMRRAFSASGRMLIVGDAPQANFSIVDVSGAPVVITPPLRYDPPAELQLVASRDAVAIANTTLLVEHWLPGGKERGAAYPTPGLAPRSACQESFWEGPDRWCGAPRVAGHFLYSLDGESLLLESEPRTVVLAQPGTGLEPQPLTRALPACSIDCAKRMYSFKP